MGDELERVTLRTERSLAARDDVRQWVCGRKTECSGEILEVKSGTSLVVQWLRLRASNAGGLGSIPGQGTRSHVPQLRSHMQQ